ncbi:hypothetical protein M5X00_26235 [Paenibacillus alvei]|uniref:hypothetical protein n=1 Tax=Paenibacillus alvei TaxID=44250 RepID=UPI00028851E8|nr:hypothetical protein [Paenibacillus alvei]EJW14101.1 hypothetical protein PAV_141p02070 [Paenibacillus alvei DSM 29]MCY9545030.1 hypothetical protein [Paenibacillus alvei]MCY9707750.1 hypothetical protein [Paenibacillus alvei]MCY9757731.1 hypothetical protein [Paenibacillus alvei]MEC0082737.1 hypothetical protein [Paenibacillus alvei]
MARVRKPSRVAKEIMEKAQELNDLFRKLPKTDMNEIIIINVNQAIDALIKEN